MKKVLLLTCSTGEGHNSAALAIQSVLERENIACERADPVSFQSERMQQAVSSLYNNMIRKNPETFGKVYKLGDLYSSTGLTSPVYWMNAHYADNLRAYIEKNEFDVVIATHLYGMEALTAIRKDPSFTIPCYGVMTDYTCIPFLEETNLTGYFIPHEDLRQELINKKIPAEKIFVSGIPVNETFRLHPGMEEARKNLGIPMDKKVYLIMTGGVGCENMMGLCDQLAGSLKKDALVLVLVGRNENLQKMLDEKYRDNPQIRTVAFTRQVAQYMAAANVMISKPGGLSSTEAAVANVPLVFLHAIPGCETCNAQFFADHAMALPAKDEAEAVEYASILAYDDIAAGHMRQMQRKTIRPDAADAIVRKAGE